MCSGKKESGMFLSLISFITTVIFFCVLFVSFNEPRPTIERLRKASEGLGEEYE